MAKSREALKNEVKDVSQSLGKIVKNTWSWLERELASGNNVAMAEILKKQVEFFKQAGKKEEDYQKEMEGFYGEMQKQRKRNFDKELEELKKNYDSRINMAKGSEEEVLRLRKEYAERARKIEGTKQAMLSPEEIKKAEGEKTANILGLAKTQEVKEASVGGVAGELTKALSAGGLGEIGSLMKVMSGMLRGVLTGGLGALGVIGGAIGLIMVIKNIEKHNKENLDATRQIAVNTGLSNQFTAKQYSQLISSLRHEFGLTRQEAQNLMKSGFAVNFGGLGESQSAMTESLRMQREAGIQFGDFSKNLRTILARNEGNAATLGTTFDVLDKMNQDFTKSGFHFTVKELYGAMNDVYGSFKNYGGELADGVGFVKQFSKAVDDGTFTFQKLIDMEKSLISLDEQKLGGFIAYGQQLGQLSDLTGDVFDQMWQLRMKGAVGGTELLNTVMASVDDLLSSRGGIGNNMEISYELVRKQFGMSQISEPEQWKKLVDLWNESGKNFNINRKQAEDIINNTKQQHDFNVKESKDYFNKALGFMNNIANRVDAIKDTVTELPTVIKSNSPSSYNH